MSELKRRYPALDITYLAHDIVYCYEDKTYTAAIWAQNLDEAKKILKYLQSFPTTVYCRFKNTDSSSMEAVFNDYFTFPVVHKTHSDKGTMQMIPFAIGSIKARNKDTAILHVSDIIDHGFITGGIQHQA